MAQHEKKAELLNRLGQLQILCQNIEREMARLEIGYSQKNVAKVNRFKKEAIALLEEIEGELIKVPKPYQKLGPQGPHKKYDHESGKYRYK